MKPLSWLALLLTLCLVASFTVVACGDDDDDDDDDFSNEPLECDEGICTDTTSRLSWQMDPPSEPMTWEEAKSYCSNLSLTGDGWHLPTISELRSLIRGCDGTITGGACGVSDSCLNSSCENEPCFSCTNGGGPNNACYGPEEMSGECNYYWSSSAVQNHDGVWVVYFDAGMVGTTIGDIYYVRCVR